MLLTRLLFQVECVLHGHVTLDGTFVVISVPTNSTGSAMMVSTDIHADLFIHGVNSIVGAFFNLLCVACDGYFSLTLVIPF